MKEFKKVRSTALPEALAVDDSSAWICENIIEIAEEEFQGFEYDMFQYGKDEYIHLMAESNNALRADLSDAVMELSMLIAMGGM